MLEEKQRMDLTGEIQEEELKRLAEAEDGSEGAKTLISNAQFSKISEKVASLEHKCSEVVLERDRLHQELTSLQQNFHAVKQALNSEIETLKERETSLKKTNELLEKGFEEQKRANLDQHGSSEALKSNIERNLILEERVAKAEADSERVRAERLLAIEELKKTRGSLEDCQLKLS